MAYCGLITQCDRQNNTYAADSNINTPQRAGLTLWEVNTVQHTYESSPPVWQVYLEEHILSQGEHVLSL